MPISSHLAFIFLRDKMIVFLLSKKTPSVSLNRAPSECLDRIVRCVKINAVRISGMLLTYVTEMTWWWSTVFHDTIGMICYSVTSHKLSVAIRVRVGLLCHRPEFWHIWVMCMVGMLSCTCRRIKQCLALGLQLPRGLGSGQWYG